MEFHFRDIEQKWQQHWRETGAYRVSNESSRPKFYVLDMFPYPSGAGLHVGHPLGYIASDIYSRFKRLKGFNVLHPMGYDAFGLPAEQYAIEHGIHPAVSTENNIKTFRRQLDNIGFCYDWEREVRTCDPGFYKWTQWIFLKLFHSFYNRKKNKAESVEVLVASFEKNGNRDHPVPDEKYRIPGTGASGPVKFTAEDWKNFNETTRQDILMQYRLSYCGIGEVNWCQALGTVLANDEVINGVSERGGHPVEKKKLRQWYLRITEYADRLLEGLETVDFSESMKDMQRNWIGKSSGAEIDFEIQGHEQKLKVYTTRPDTIFGVDFMVIAPELDIVHEIRSEGQAKAVDQYLDYVKSRSERERMAEKKITGVFTGAYAINPFDGREIPVWISEYVLAGYGTGAIMAVPCGDQRDFLFAKHFSIPITNIIGAYYNETEANPTKEALLENSGFITGMKMSDAIDVVIQKLEEQGTGIRKVNYKMRDAAFSRQRYWGEPFPIIWKDGVAYPQDEQELPVLLPHMDDLKPGPDGEGPLSNLADWKQVDGGIREVNTMPGYAGSSWYFLRYMDPNNESEFCSRQASDYWGQVDLYIGGTEHAVGHLLYSRMWTKFLFDIGLIGHDEPYKKLVNQGMIQGSSRFVYRVQVSPLFEKDPINYKKQVFASYNIARKIIENGSKHAMESYELIKANISDYPFQGEKLSISINEIHVDVNIVDGLELDTEAFKKWRGGEYANAEFILEDGKYICGVEVEKMSKSKFNTVNPDDLVAKYGADTFRMYEMFLGPVELSKPWDTKGIEGVHRFLKKLWRLFFEEQKGPVWTDEKPSEAELKILHKTIRKIEEDTERFSFNTAVSAFMICVNELTDLKCHKKEILQPLLILLAPYAPHVSEELWRQTGGEGSILDASFPRADETYLKESSKTYPVAINGKTRTELTISLEATQQEVEEIVLKDDVVLKWLDGKPHKKIIYVKNKMINIVV